MTNDNAFKIFRISSFLNSLNPVLKRSLFLKLEEKAGKAKASLHRSKIRKQCEENNRPIFYKENAFLRHKYFDIDNVNCYLHIVNVILVLFNKDRG